LCPGHPSIGLGFESKANEHEREPTASTNYRDDDCPLAIASL
jgi:hypothetical protein